MSLNIGDNFSYLGAKPLDTRRVYTNKAALSAVSLSTVYEGMIVYVKSEDKYYRLKSGTWVEFSAGSGIGDWTANTAYTVDDIVINSSKLYICTTAHTSGSSFDTTEQANWKEVGSSGAGITLWTTNVSYNIGDIVYYANSLYRCNTAHTSGTFSTDSAKWDLIFADLKTWDDSTYYSADVVVINGSKIYKCITAHTSGLTFDTTEEANWQELCVGGSGITSWITATPYEVGDIVIYENSLYKCNTLHTSTTFSADGTNWDLVFADLKLWQVSTYYTVGVCVIEDNKLYRCNTAHTSDSTDFSNDILNWDLIVCDGTPITDWKDNVSYKVGDLVIYSNTLFQCNTAHTSGSTFDASELANWDIIGEPSELTTAQVQALIANFNPAGDGLMQLDDWTANHGYTTKQVVYYSGSMYRCNIAHTSTTTFDPSKWTQIVGGSGTSISDWVASTNYQVGDFVIYQNKLYKCTTANVDATFTIANWQGISVEDVMNGATASVNGKEGLVPKPNAGDEGKYLRGDGTWQTLTSSVFATTKRLWTGNLYQAGQSATLVDSIYNYNYIIVYMINGDVSVTAIGVFRPSIDNGCGLVYTNNSNNTFSAYLNINSATQLDMPVMLGLTQANNHIGYIEGIKFEQGNGEPIQDWIANTNYVVGNLVVKDKSIYQCITANTDATWTASKWQMIGGGTSIDDWVTSTSYSVGDYVRQNNIIYVCNTAHTSSTFNTDKTNWTAITSEEMVGATSSANGKAGIVPAPTTSDTAKFLKGDGTWGVPSGTSLGIISETLWDNPSGNQVVLNDVLNFTHSINDYDYIVIIKVTGGYSSVVIEPDSLDGNRTIMCTSLSSGTFSNFGISLLANTVGTSCTITYIEGSGTISSIVGWKFVNPLDYSTTEKRVGTWVDGKPLYQKTLTGSCPSAVGTFTSIANLSSLGMAQLISIEGFVTDTTGTDGSRNMWPICQSDASGGNKDISVILQMNQQLVMATKQNLSAETYYITIKYTKV